jgi:death-on-curing protein
VKAPEWVEREIALAIHERLISEFGGMSGIRDEGLLESALARPRQLFAYETHSLFALSAAYASGIVRNHPFVDGNKRIGFTVAILFLELNGYEFLGSEAEATMNTLGLAARELSEEEYCAWLKKNSRRVPRAA